MLATGKAVLKRLLKIGTTGISSEPQRAVRITLTNAIAIFAVAMTVVFTTLQVAMDQWLFILPNSLTLLVFLGVFLANANNRYNTARAIVILTPLITIIYYSRLMGFDIGLYLFVYSSAGLAITLFRATEYRWIIFTLVCAIATHMFLYGKADDWQVGTAMLPTQVTQIMQTTNWAISFVAVVFPYALFFYLNYRNEQSLEDRQLKLIQASRLSALGEMAGGIAHEINNPLAVITGHTYSVVQGIDQGTITAAEIRRAVLTVESTAIRISRLSENLRKLGQASGPDRKKLPESTSVREIVENLMLSYAAKLRELGIEVEINLESRLIICSPVEITHVLLGLVNNAIDALEDATDRRLEISGKAVRNFYELRVKNSGPRIPSDLASRIFDPFFTTKPVGKGTGLGLSLAHKIMSTNGGTIQLDLKAADTTFVISIPTDVSR